jgi:hypothetical protein
MFNHFKFSHNRIFLTPKLKISFGSFVKNALEAEVKHDNILSMKHRTSSLKIVQWINKEIFFSLALQPPWALASFSVS